MSDSWLEPDVSALLETAAGYILPITVLISTIFTIIILTLPSQYTYFNNDYITENVFSKSDKRNGDKSGYTYFQTNKDTKGLLKPKTTTQVLVLGDIGRSPRMQYHALSLATNGARVSLIGYVESEIHPDIQANRFITVVPLSPFPKRLQRLATNKLYFLFISTLKIVWQVGILYRTLGYRSKASKWLLVQNPPSIPTLAVATWICFFRKTKLVIDWHNFGYSILALRLGDDDPLVRLAMRWENHYAKYAVAHFAVTDAMVRVLKERFRVEAMALHDRPAEMFRPLTEEKRREFRGRLPELLGVGEDLEVSRHRLLVSSTSWTADEDFDLLLSALQKYAMASSLDSALPPLLFVITGKGPTKTHYEHLIDSLTKSEKLPNVIIKTAWLSIEDYASLLGTADLGVSLHTSSSGVDLPMKVVDMLGTALPVAGWSDFEAWPELVQEGVNGRGFKSADELTGILTELFLKGGSELAQLRKGAMRDCERRWNEEWMPVAGKLFQLE